MTGKTKAELELELNAVKDEVDKRNNFNPSEYRDKTRSKIAFVVVRFYFLILTVVLIGVPVYNFLLPEEKINLLLDIKDILGLLSGIISAPFGFIVGYYFKSSEKE